MHNRHVGLLPWAVDPIACLLVHLGAGTWTIPCNNAGSRGGHSMRHCAGDGNDSIEVVGVLEALEYLGPACCASVTVHDSYRVSLLLEVGDNHLNRVFKRREYDRFP